MYDEIYEVNNFESNIIAAPTVWTNFIDVKTLDEQLLNRPTAIILKLDKDLNIINKSEKHDFYKIIDKIYTKIIPIFAVDDLKVAENLSKELQIKNFVDYFILSNNKEVFNTIKKENKYARFIYKYENKKDVNNKEELNNILDLYNSSYSQSLLMFNTNINKSSVEYLQKRGVFVVTNSNDTKINLYQNLTLGSNGILVAGNYNNLLDIYKDVPENTIIRKTFSIAHRGYHKEYPENTIESGLAAISLGAEIIELDVRLTRDLEVVVIHDDNTNRISNENVSVKNMWSILKNVKLNNSKGLDIYIPHFRDYLEVFKEQDVVLFVEIKEKSDLLVEKTLEIIYEMEMQHDVLIISFNETDIKKVRELDKTIPVGYLIGDIKEENESLYVKKMLDLVMPHSSKVNISHHALSKIDLFNINARGITAWPWTVNGDRINSEILKGSSGITTDDSHLLSNVITNHQIEINKNNNKYIIKSDFNYRDGTNATTEMDYQVLNNSDNIIINDDVYELKNKEDTFMLASYSFKLSDGTMVNVLAEVVSLEVSKNKTIGYIAIIGATILVFGIAALIVVKKR